ncbi:trigger factor [Prevotella sp. CAG:924]|nr:trigger factor [Prevotella sp. CAG:924]
MNISFECPDKVNGLMTITIEEADFSADVEKTLKDYRKKANYPGFRPGQVPMNLIRRQYGSAVKMDVINKKLGESLQKYLSDNNINMIGEPLASEKQEPQDLEKDAPYTFVFDIAVAPEFDVTLGQDDTVDYYDITVDDKVIDDQVSAIASRAGKYEQVDDYQDNDMLKGDLRELDAEGNTLEGGITVEGAVLMPSYIKVDDQKKLFDGAKKGDIITFNPRKAYPESDVEVSSLLKIKKEEVAAHTGDFSFQITEISRFKTHEVNQELFDLVLGKDEVKTEEDFRKKLGEMVKEQLDKSADFRFLYDVRAYAEKKVGDLAFPDALLKRIVKQNNPKASDEDLEKNYEPSVKELKWSLIQNKLATQFSIKVEDADVKNAAKEMARMQFAQYGMNNVPEEYVDNYTDELLKKRENVNNFVQRALDAKLTAAVKDAVKLNKKAISLDDFNKLAENDK